MNLPGGRGGGSVSEELEEVGLFASSLYWVPLSAGKLEPRRGFCSLLGKSVPGEQRLRCAGGGAVVGGCVCGSDAPGAPPPESQPGDFCESPRCLE